MAELALPHRLRLWSSIAILVIANGVGAVAVHTRLREAVLEFSFASLVVSAVVLLMNAESLRLRGWLAFGIAAAVGFMVEVVGHATGVIFGSYTYTSQLGPRWLDVPLVIGLNWAVLLHAFHAILSGHVAGRLPRIGLGALGMTAVDWVMEPAAVALDYWHWRSPEIPLQNYLAWFVISAGLFGVTELLVPKTTNRLAPVLLGAFLVFFVSARFSGG